MPELLPEQSSFNSRPHEEVDGSGPGPGGSPCTFNSRPHEEVDRRFQWSAGLGGLSIHDLTKRSTLPARSALVRHHSFNSRPHEEVDGYRKTRHLPSVSFNSRPHEEVDGAERVYTSSFCTFQFTTSRRGRPRPDAGASALVPFNSRPHEEVDVDGLC